MLYYMLPAKYLNVLWIVFTNKTEKKHCLLKITYHNMFYCRFMAQNATENVHGHTHVLCGVGGISVVWFLCFDGLMF